MMVGPLIYVGTHKIQPDKLDVARKSARELAEFLEANHPRMVAFQIFIDDDAATMTVIQVHPDDDSLALHLELARERIASAYDFLVGTTRIDIFGTPNEALGQQIVAMAMGAPLSFHTADAGFSRLGALTA